MFRNLFFSTANFSKSSLWLDLERLLTSTWQPAQTLAGASIPADNESLTPSRRDLLDTLDLEENGQDRMLKECTLVSHPVTFKAIKDHDADYCLASFDVPGVMENRPQLSIGDSIILRAAVCICVARSFLLG